MQKQKILVVGAGFAGAVIARELADNGNYEIDIIDSRNHIAGNCYDPYDTGKKLRIHQYGPHIFHTNDQSIVDYLSRFTKWIPYQHKVEALVDGIGYVPLPINITTINRLYNKNFTQEQQMREFLDKVKTKHKKVDNARTASENIFGQELVELFFARYTKKMWDLDLEQLPASIVARLPIRYDNSTGYFNDKFQAMPQQGYIQLFENLLNHPDIHISLNTHFDKAMETQYNHVFNSMAIDEFYDYEFGKLPYRSIKYQHENQEKIGQKVPTVNFTDISAITRFTDWRLYPGCGTDKSDILLTYEQPCSYEDNNNERYYPVKTVDNVPQKIYKQYETLSLKNKKMTFIGRCGQYRYLDMHQVIANSRMLSKQYFCS
ncbi:MAG: NAD(P)-binding protein [Gammaproteobacteria bacterium]|nr:NAD(P)-binding protein [Gammaproteobacteria bacterium]